MSVGAAAHLGNPAHVALTGLLEDHLRLRRLFGCAQTHDQSLALAQQLLYAPLFDQLASLQNRHTVADLLDLVEDVAGEEDRLARRGQAQDQLTYLVHTSGIEAVGWLIKQDK